MRVNEKNKIKPKQIRATVNLNLPNETARAVHCLDFAIGTKKNTYQYI